MYLAKVTQADPKSRSIKQRTMTTQTMILTDSHSPESSSIFDGKRAIEELIRGREIAKKLQAVLYRQPIGSDCDESSLDELVEKILGSFTETISMLHRKSSDDKVSRFPATPLCDCDGHQSEVSEQSIKTFPFKARRGCYKRRKTSESWTKVSPVLVDDGHAWRKYGQKVIHNSKHPRSYFRCTHKYDQGCQASKQVQRTEEDPPMFRTTYNGHHTCKNIHKSPQIALDPTTDVSFPNYKDSTSFLLSFESNNPCRSNKTKAPPTYHHDHDHDQDQMPFSKSSTMINRERREDDDYQKLSGHNHASLSKSNHDYFLSPDLTVFGSSGSSGDGTLSGVYSCTASTTSNDLEMGMMVGAVGFDGDWQLEF